MSMHDTTFSPYDTMENETDRMAVSNAQILAANGDSFGLAASLKGHRRNISARKNYNQSVSVECLVMPRVSTF